MTASDTRVAVRLRGGWTLLSAETDALEAVCPLPVSASAVVRSDHLGRWWSIDGDARVVEGFAWEDGALRRLGRHVLPDHFEARDLTGDAGRVFVGGSFRYCAEQPEAYGPALLACAIGGATVWQRLDVLCPQWMRWDKAFDGVAVVGTELIGVDDVVRPKFIDRYDLSYDPPLRRGGVEMPTGPNERTEHGVTVGGQWLAVRAHARFEGGVYRSITLYRLPDLRPTARFKQSRRWSSSQKNWSETADAFRLYGTGFVGTVLVVACGDDGFASIDCSGLEPLPAQSAVIANSPWDPVTRTLGEAKDQPSVRYPLVDLDARVQWERCAEGRRCVDVVAVPSRGAVVVVEAHGDARTARRVSLAERTGS